jgi:phage repressor protein C with HTH and peptisase S24 domain
MSPTLRDGDLAIAWHGRTPRIGDVVLARYRSMPDRPVVKRLVRASGDGWWLASDNASAGGDSSVHGIADVDATIVLRIRRGIPRRMRSSVRL